jgi:CheY-like chemotaxis protein
VRTASFLVFALALTLASSGRMDAQPKKQKTPTEIYTQFRDTMNEGKFDIAGLFLEDFLASNPTEKDFLAIEAKYGTTVFQQLRTVPKYSDDPATEKKIRDNIEELNKRASETIAKILYRPERVRKYIANLGATYEEKVFAQQELKRTGEYAIPFLLEAIRQNPSPELYAGILDTIPVLEAPTMAGWVAALDGLGVDRQYGVLEAISLRRDVLNLLSGAQTDITPHLWRILASDPKTTPQNLRDLALKLLNRFYPGLKPDTKRPEVELVALANKFYNHKARYLGAKTNPDGSPTQVPLWIATTQDNVVKLEKLNDVPAGQADEYYGLRYARWALESKPEFEPAQSMILSLAAERAIERAKFGQLSVAEPGVYKLLADAPSATLNDLLARGLAEKRTQLVLAMVQVLGDRADRLAATPPAGPTPKPSLLLKALSYPDPAVQFAAATALLRSPVPVPLDVRPTIVDILRRAAGMDPGMGGESKGTALLADPGMFRADANSLVIRSFGFTVEQFPTGRDLLRRVAKSSDFDVIFIDHHTASPELIDLISQLQSDPRTAARPIFVIASTDKPRSPSFDQLLVRLAAIIAATENDVLGMIAPFVPDKRNTVDEIEKLRKENQQKRDATFRNAWIRRIARLQRVLDTLPLTLSDQQKTLLNLRIQLLTYTMLAAEFPMSRESAPETMADIDRIRKQISIQPPTPVYGVGIPSTDLMKLIDRLELDIAKVKASQEKYDFLRLRVDPSDIGLKVESFRDPAIEAKLARTLKNYPTVRIIPEPYSRLALEAEFKALFADPKMVPREAATKQAEAKQAVYFLRQMAMGDIPGYDIKSAEAELVAALQSTDRDVVSAAIDAVERFKTGEAQRALLELATGSEQLHPARTVAIRRQAADAVIRHIRAYGKAATPEMVAKITKLTEPDGEPDAELRGKFLTLKGMLAFNSSDFVKDLKSYSPPVIPPAPKVDPKKEPEPKP